MCAHTQESGMEAPRRSAEVEALIKSLANITGRSGADEESDRKSRKLLLLLLPLQRV